jgi:hypothetical protein
MTHGVESPGGNWWFLALIVVYLNLCRLLSYPLNMIFSNTKSTCGWLHAEKGASRSNG